MEREPTLQVLGVFRVPIMEEELRNQLYPFFFSDSALQDRDRRVNEYIRDCVPLVVFELQLNDLDERFSFDDFTQPVPDRPRNQWQAGYDEAILSPDGSLVLARGISCTHGLCHGRIAFYFHFYDLQVPMKWSYGEFACPPVELLPKRLLPILPYCPVD